MNNFKVYLVGGAVRDSLLNRPVVEHDYVVVGATVTQMLELGFSQVGADFPVFLHPRTHDEYALARTERKNGNGYLGFTVHADPSVTLEEDLIRRDLTINAMAIEVNGLFDSTFKTGKFDKNHVIDPYGGLSDLAEKKLRHVSEAFCEDPVRVLRLARFVSRYAPFGFSIADETVKLVQKMRDDGELNHLVAERVWAETFKALGQEYADVYFNELNKMGVLGVIMPSFAIIHDEARFGENLTNGLTDNWQFIAKSLRVAHALNGDVLLKFGILSLVFRRFDSQKADFDFYKKFCQDLKIPKQYQGFGEYLLTNFDKLQNFERLTDEQMFELIKPSLKDSQKLNLALTAIKILQLAKQQIFVQTSIQKLNNISINSINGERLATLKGKAIGDEIDNLRKSALANLLNSVELS